MKRFFPPIVLLVALAVAAPSLGSRSDPEIVDPEGDALVIDEAGPHNAAWADITAAWFASVRNVAGTLVGFRVHVRTAARPDPSRDVTYGVNWRLDAGQPESCMGLVQMWRTSSAGYGTLAYRCDGDDGQDWFARVPVRFAGDTAVAFVALRQFDRGASAGLYGPGAWLVPGSAFTSSARSVANHIDQSCAVQDSLVGRRECNPRPFVIGR